jgi:trimeric autotransporter adhesin
MATINGDGNANRLTGTNGNDILRGLGAADQLRGLGGHDLLDGGNGNDLMIGGLGNDTYVIDSIGDATIEGAGAGIDRIRSSISWTLGANIEHLTLIGAAARSGTGNSLSNIVIGSAAANTLRGLAGNDTLTGMSGNDRLEGSSGHDRLDGGLGNDAMIGGAGNDTYVVNSARDSVVENASAGTDRVLSSVSHVLRANVEILALVGGAAIGGTGNDLDNVVSGNSASNVLRGLGGNDLLDGRGGSDTMIGGAGNDIYVVDSAGDGVVEAAGGGADTVRSSVSFSLTPTADIETLTLLGVGNLNGTGNDIMNIIDGNAGDNTLDGRGGNDQLFGNGGSDVLQGGAGDDTLDGGPGDDTMTGGAGDDVYRVDSASDQVVELAGGGSDFIESVVTFDLRTTPEVESLVLKGTADIDGTGHDGGSQVFGNSGDNVLRGGTGIDDLGGEDGNDVLIGGTGRDNLDGGAGLDAYRFVSASDSLDVAKDFIFSFDQGEDKIDLNRIDANQTNDMPPIATNDDFTFIGTAAFTAPGQVRYLILGTSTFVWANVDGTTTTAEWAVEIVGRQLTLTDGDFIL